MNKSVIYSLLLACLLTLAVLPACMAQGQHTIGYCPDDLSAAQAVGTTDGQSATVSAAICLPRPVAMRYQGCTIGKIRFAVRQGMQNVSVFIRTQLGSSSVVVQSVASVQDGWNEVTLNQPYTLTGAPVYIGYSAQMPQGTAGILTTSATADENTSWLSVAGQWQDCHASGLGSLFIQAIASGEAYDHDVALGTLTTDKDCYATTEQLSLTAEVLNAGTAAESGLSLTTYVDDHAAQTTQALPQSLAAGQSVSLTQAFTLSALAEGRHTATAIVTADGDQRHQNDTLRTTFYVYATPYARTVLLEHFTSLPCVNCPPVDRLLEEVVSGRNDVVWAAHHVGYADDEFTLAASQPLTRFGVNGNPYVMLDRNTLQGYFTQPAFTIGAYSAEVVNAIFSYAAAQPALVSLQAQASMGADGQLHISIAGQGKTFVPELYPRATLHLLLVEDQVEAQGVQAGDASKKQHDNIVRTFVTGQRGVLPTWDAEGRFTYETTATPDAAWHADHLRVVAFMTAQAATGTNYPTGQVLNATQAQVGASSGVATARTDASRPQTIHDAAGRLLQSGSTATGHLPKGLYIISNGTHTRKIINK